MLLLLFIGQASAIVDHDGQQRAEAQPPIVFMINDRWIFQCIATDPPSSLYICAVRDGEKVSL